MIATAVKAYTQSSPERSKQKLLNRMPPNTSEKGRGGHTSPVLNGGLSPTNSYAGKV